MMSRLPHKVTAGYCGNTPTTFRSVLESAWAEFFRMAGLQYEYEPKRFCYPDGIIYTPDFKVENLGYIEVKPTLALFKSETMRKVQRWTKDEADSLYVFYGPAGAIDRSILFEKSQMFAPTWRQVAERLQKAAPNGKTCTPECFMEMLSHSRRIVSLMRKKVITPYDMLAIGDISAWIT